MTRNTKPIIVRGGSAGNAQLAVLPSIHLGEVSPLEVTWQVAGVPIVDPYKAMTPPKSWAVGSPYIGGESGGLPGLVPVVFDYSRVFSPQRQHAGSKVTCVVNGVESDPIILSSDDYFVQPLPDPHWWFNVHYITEFKDDLPSSVGSYDISTWPNAGAAGDALQANATYQPSYVVPVSGTSRHIDFNGTDTFFEISDPGNPSSSWTIYEIGLANASATGDRPLVGFADWYYGNHDPAGGSYTQETYLVSNATDHSPPDAAEHSALDQWCLRATVCDPNAGEVRYYVGGTLISTVSTTFAGSVTAETATLGRGAGSYFYGSLKFLALYPESHTPLQVAQMVEWMEDIS